LTIGFASLAVKEFNSKTNICLLHNAISKESFGCMLGFTCCSFKFFNLSPHYFEKHILEVDSVQKDMIFNLFFQMFI
jgi:hypothetical protein